MLKLQKLVLTRFFLFYPLLLLTPVTAFSDSCTADRDFCVLQDYEPGLILAINAHGKAEGCQQMNLANGFPSAEVWPDVTSISGENQRRCLHVQESCPALYPETIRWAQKYFHEHCD